MAGRGELWGLSSRVSECVLTASITDHMYDPGEGSPPLKGSVLSLSSFYFIFGYVFYMFVCSQKLSKLGCWLSIKVDYEHNTSLFVYLTFPFCNQSTTGVKCHILFLGDEYG